MGVGGQRHATATLPPVETRYAMYIRLGGPQGQSGRMQNISLSPPPRFDPRTVQPVASRYTDYARTYELYVSRFLTRFCFLGRP